MNQEKIGKFIAQKRKEKNLKQEDLAFLLGVSAKTISRWETGRNMPDLALLKSLSKELNITINDLLSGEVVEPKDYQEKYEENINKVLLKADKDNKRKILILLFIISLFLLLYRFVSNIILLKKMDINYFYVLDQHLNIVPLINSYTSLKFEPLLFFQNVLVNFSFTFLVISGLYYFKIFSQNSFLIFLVLMVLKELLKWLFLIGFYDIDDILMQVCFYFILRKILFINKKKL